MSVEQNKPEKHVEYLYVDTPTIHPRAIKGTHRSLKTWLGIILVGLTVLLPWIRWDRGPDMPTQAIMFSFADMRAYIFDTVIWAQQFYLLTGILILACLVLFLATALYGRIWCGFTCPQTVWTDLFVRIERLTEGDRNARMKLEREGWTANKISRKVVKHTLWLLVSAVTGLIFLGFFTDIVQAAVDLPTGNASATLYGFFALFVGSTYVMAGWVREQMCIYMCPWPRIQGGMLDEFTLNVTYDEARGEKRGFAKKGEGFEQRGHCVDCKMCVQVCPTGIDIRDGAQMACINCALCIDACDGVMARFNLPPNLIGWRTLNSAQKPKLFRPRTLIYLGLIAVVGLGILLATSLRREVDLSVLADRSPSSVRLSDGSVRDGYTVKLVNRRHESINGVLAVTGISGIHLSQLSGEQDVPALHVTADPDTVTTIRVFVRQDANAPKADHAGIQFTFGNNLASAKSVFQVDQSQ
ncbi:MAG TPA: cytochrome c oxidase accessory protein CcoG [Candidatus Sulfotelmatobacter sp.]|jgi:cytochrome c oxidase accessory protein FixG|nr:cytochrome c oxidase accessory protein CcoG [Candidatus Sulfotelmatobacter sp.]